MKYVIQTFGCEQTFLFDEALFIVHAYEYSERTPNQEQVLYFEAKLELPVFFIY